MMRLEDKCMNLIAKQIANAPVVIQENVIGVSKEFILDQCKEVVNAQLNYLPTLVSDIMEDEIRLHMSNGTYQVSYNKVYRNVYPEMVDCARKIVDQMMLEYGDEIKINKFDPPVDEMADDDYTWDEPDYDIDIDDIDDPNSI